MFSLRRRDHNVNLAAWTGWFGPVWGHTYLVRRDGREARLRFLDLRNCSWTEAPDGTVWVLTSTELLRVRDEGVSTGMPISATRLHTMAILLEPSPGWLRLRMPWRFVNGCSLTVQPACRWRPGRRGKCPRCWDRAFPR